MGTTGPVSRKLAVTIGLTALLVCAAVPAAAFGRLDPGPEPIVGPELPVAYPLTGTPRYGENPAVASGGSVSLAAWRELDRGVVVARVDRAGTVVDPAGIRLSDREFATAPAVAFDGTNFLVVFEGDAGVFARRVSEEGDVLDETDIQVSFGEGFEVEPAVDFDGTNYLVIWSDVLDSRDTWGDVHGTRVSPGGVVLDPAGLPIATATGNQSEVDVAFNGSHHLVVWTDSEPQDIDGTLVTTAGAALTPLGLPISSAVGSQSRAAVASTGTSFFVAWEDQRAGGRGDVYGARVDATGTVLDPSGIAISTTPGYDAVPEVASDGSDVLVVFLSAVDFPTALFGTRIDPSGTVLDPSGVALPTAGIESALAFDGDHYVLVGWTPEAIRGARLTPNLAVLDPAGITISTGANGQTGSATGFDGTNTLVVWSDDRSDGAGPGLYGARVGPDGQVLDGTGFPISTGSEEYNRPDTPSVAFDGTSFLVTWLDHQRRAVRAATVSRDGDVLDQFDVHVATAGNVRSAVVAYGGGRFLVAWYESVYLGSETSRHDLRATRLTSDGEVVDPSGFLIASQQTTTGPPTVDVAFGSTDFLVVWDSVGFPGRSIDGALVSPSAPVPAPEPFQISPPDQEQAGARLAWNGAAHLVVWTTSAGGRGDPLDLHGARVDGAGTVLDPSGITISTAPGDQQAPTVAANGPFLVTWVDRRRGIASVNDLYATRIDADGTVGHPEGFAVATAISNDDASGNPVTAAPGLGNFSVGYERFVADDPYWSSRTFIRHVTPK